MMKWRWLERIQSVLRRELQHLAAVNSSDRRWHLPLCAALANGLPLLVGVWFDHLDYGLISSLGGLVFLYMPNTPMSHRMVSLMVSAFGMAACYALGLMCHFLPALLVPVLAFIAIVVSMICRFYALGPPGSLFFVMAAAIGAYSPLELEQLPLFVGLLTMGALLACLLAFFYSLYVLRLQAPTAVAPLPPASFDFVVFDSLVIGVFVGIALALAQVLQLERPYWVPVSCLAVIQGASLRAVWNKQAQRIIGTGIGLVLAWGLLQLPLNSWRVALLMMLLAFIIENLVVRHYGMAAIFITPLTIFLAEATHLGLGSPDALLLARLLDTVIGCVVGLLGGACLHSPGFRRTMGGQIRRLIPSRFGE